ncbi:hypothetical protein ACFQ88_26690 [Paenibacillus sp. NPDC056579]|uniref:hypothetical protein n=1 Tax=Paenibacillus sp. NPDC056579 TaxID=3345871 RepID=UPI0036AC7C5A
MYKKWLRSRWIAAALTLSMLFSMLPQLGVSSVQAAGGDLEVRFGAGTRIGNETFSADNAFLNFYNNQTPGFAQTETDKDANYDWASGHVLPKNDDGLTVQFQIKVADNPALRALAQSKDAEVFVGWDKLDYDEDCILAWCKTRVTSASITVDGQELSGSSHGGDTFYRSMTKQIKDNSVINISVWVEGEGAGAYGIFIKFQDKHRPVLENYTFRGNGAERTNGIINQEELYAKQNEYISLAYNFNEPVKPTALSSAFYEHFLKHPLFVNPDGTGLPAAGQQQYMQNTSFAPGDFSLGYFDAPLRQSIEYKYITTKYHHSGNLPLEPKITGTASGAPIDQTLEQKLKGAVLADAAGNVAVIDSNKFIKVSDSSNNHLKGKTVNPFDYNHGGYRVIVDAVAPKYSKTGNGIQPEILTGVVLSKDDHTLEFTVQLTEEAVVKSEWKNEEEQTFLLFNNGMKAYYDSGFNSSKLTFKTNVKDVEKWLETPLLKVISLSHDLKNPADSDTSVIQDYAGNMLIQPANFEGIHVDGDESNVNSKIDWAKLSVDYTKPWIAYRYEAGGATDATYRRNGKVTIDANDPPLIIPPLDPSPDRGAERPSKGIYRPSNMTGEASPAVGLVYYYWSRNPEDPFASVSEHNFAAVKRYALAGKQPEEELYPKSKFGGMQLKVVNNKTNMIAPPAEALTDEGSGVWYLHTWTADMTWDSARELMQHKKKDEYVTNHPDEYERWKNEATGSEADKEFYATNKALAAVGDYGNLGEWTFDDYKQNDSNWTYNAASMKLDNRAPVITIDVNNAEDKKTGNVKVPVTIVDEHSGVQTGSSSGLSQFAYQWVKKGEELQEIEWKTAEFAGNGVTLATQNDIMEDGTYALAIKAADQAGNERVVKSEEAIEVDSTNRVVGQLSDANPEFVQSHDIEFRLQGLAPATVTFAAYGKSVTEATYKSKGLVTNAVYGGISVTSSAYGMLGSFVTNVGYAFSGSVARPGDGAYAPLVLQQINPANGELLYRIPADRTKNGEQFVHIRVMESDGRQHYFTKMYKFDNLPPAVTFSKSGVEYPLAKQTVTISIEDTSKNVLLRQYQWVKAGMPEPDEQSAGWVDIPANGEVGIDNNGLQPGETADYRLFVKAVDGANNSVVVRTTGIFKVSKAGPGTPAADAEAALIYLYGDAQDGYTAIMKLNLDREDKNGYEYSLSADNGISWVKWHPYTNFTSMKVPTNKAAELHIQVKYRAPGGAIGKPAALDTSNVKLGIEPVYALAAVSSKPANPQTGVDIDITVPIGIKIVPSDVNPSPPIRSGNRFNVKENGFYSFDLTDASDISRKDTLYVSIGNIDTTEPNGTVTNMRPATTNGNVSVMLEDLSEPVTITNNNGKAVYTFENNGSFAFEFSDEAGNKGTAEITVSNIDKEEPDVKIVRSYAYGENYSQTFETIKDENGSILYSSGVTLEVQKANAQAKDFVVLSGKSVITMEENGVASFVVSDRLGNTSVVREEVTNIISAAPVPESVTYTFVDEKGNPLPEERIVTIDGKKYARGQVQVSVSGKTKSPNKVFSGMAPIMQNGAYTNQISAPDGTYSYSRVYSADGSTMLAISDLLGNIKKVPVTIAGLDNKAPEIALNTAAVSIVQNKPDFDFGKDLGGYTVSDNVSKPEQIRVEISGLDLTKLGRQRVTYTAFDQVGNMATAYQDVVVVSAEGMLIFADDVLISGGSTESALFDHNTLDFHITKYNLMDVEGWSQVNEWGTYDVLYYSGLYREGQMKYIAEKLTYDELVNKQFAIEFDKVGWYTMIVRTQEREREYAMFFIGNVD